jgi:hypothetical protein
LPEGEAQPTEILPQLPPPGAGSKIRWGQLLAGGLIGLVVGLAIGGAFGYGFATWTARRTLVASSTPPPPMPTVTPVSRMTPGPRSIATDADDDADEDGVEMTVESEPSMPVPQGWSELEKQFVKMGYKRDPFSGNYLSPRTAARTLNEPLEVLYIDGKKCVDLRGNPVRLRRSVAQRLVRADLKFFAAKSRHLKVGYGFRTNALQQELYRTIKAKGGVVAPPGHSFHETGQAVDLSRDTWKAAQRYLMEEGLMGGCKGIEDDVVHYSIGELTPPRGLLKKLGKGFKEVKCWVKSS